MSALTRRDAVLALGALAGTMTSPVWAATKPKSKPKAGHKPEPDPVVRIDGMAPGTLKTVAWQGLPFVIVRTSDMMLDDLRDQTPHTWSQRTIPADGPMFFVFSKTAPGSGCTLVHAIEGTPRYAPERPWQGGLYDPCRFGEWDYAGRCIRQYPDQDDAMRRPDLEVPKFELEDGVTLRFVR